MGLGVQTTFETFHLLFSLFRRGTLWLSFLFLSEVAKSVCVLACYLIISPPSSVSLNSLWCIKSLLLSCFWSSKISLKWNHRTVVSFWVPLTFCFLVIFSSFLSFWWPFRRKQTKKVYFSLLLFNRSPPAHCLKLKTLINSNIPFIPSYLCNILPNLFLLFCFLHLRMWRVKEWIIMFTLEMISEIISNSSFYRWENWDYQLYLLL